MAKFYINVGKKKLFAIFNPSIFELNSSTGVVLSYPFGQEYIRCYKIYQNLANNLSKAGIPSIRFDFYNCGDSAGNIEDVSINQWLDDLEIVVHEFKKMAGVSKIFIIGVRFGASLAALAASRMNLDGLGLCAPIINGKEYIHELRDIHKTWLNGSFAKCIKSKDVYFESMGFEIQKQLFNDIKQFNLLEVELNEKIKILYIDKTWDNSLVQFFEKRNITHDLKHLVNQNFWLKKEGEDNKRIIPIQEINYIINWIKTKLN